MTGRNGKSTIGLSVLSDGWTIKAQDTKITSRSNTWYDTMISGQEPPSCKSYHNLKFNHIVENLSRQIIRYPYWLGSLITVRTWILSSMLVTTMIGWFNDFLSPDVTRRMFTTAIKVGSSMQTDLSCSMVIAKNPISRKWVELTKFYPLVMLIAYRGSAFVARLFWGRTSLMYLCWPIFPKTVVFAPQISPFSQGKKLPLLSENFQKFQKRYFPCTLY